MRDLADVIDQMAGAGMPTPPARLDVSGRIRRFGPKKRAWYVLREVTTDAGSMVIVGAFGEWGRIDKTLVEVDWRGISDDERAAVRQRLAAQEQEELAQRAKRAAIAALRAGQLWASASRDGVSPYLTRKRVDAESVRFLPDGSVVVPMVRYDLPRECALVGAQVIAADGGKRFTPGTAKQGSACRLGLVEIGQPILLCEGLATGLSIRMAINNRAPVFVAFDAGNLLPVANVLRGQFPSSPILLCADDDFRTEGNPGIKKGTEVSKKVPYAHLIYPVFPGLRGEKDTDFNDLHVKHGLGVVARQFASPLAYLGRLVVRPVGGLNAA